MYQLPTTIPFAETFKAVLREVADNGTENQSFSFSYAGSPAGIRAGYVEAFGGDVLAAKEAFDMDLSNAIGDASMLLSVDEAFSDAEALGELYDLAEEIGFSWYDADDAEGAA